MTRMPAAFILLALCTAACAAESAQPYAGQQVREIKALSSEQVEGLLAGRGMSLALSAELNGYPGPKHVQELAEDLQLTAEQTALTDALFTNMQQQAAALGAELVEAERELEHLFASGTVDVQNLQAALERIGRISARLRLTHLQAHIEQTALLTTDQVAAYNRLRGYAGASGAGEHHGAHGRHP